MNLRSALIRTSRLYRANKPLIFSVLTSIGVVATAATSFVSGTKCEVILSDELTTGKQKVTSVAKQLILPTTVAGLTILCSVVSRHAHQRQIAGLTALLAMQGDRLAKLRKEAPELYDQVINTPDLSQIGDYAVCTVDPDGEYFFDPNTDTILKVKPEKVFKAINMINDAGSYYREYSIYEFYEEVGCPDWQIPEPYDLIGWNFDSLESFYKEMYGTDRVFVNARDVEYEIDGVKLKRLVWTDEPQPLYEDRMVWP